MIFLSGSACQNESKIARFFKPKQSASPPLKKTALNNAGGKAE